MGNKYINNFDDYDENIDIISDSSRMPKKSSKSSRNPQRPQTQRPQNRQYKKRPQRIQNAQSNQITQKLPYNQYKRQAKVAKKKPKTPGKIFAKVFFTVILICILILALAFGYISNIFGDMKYKDTNKDNAYIDESLLIGDSGVKNILLIGGDARKGETSFRSDTMMLVSIDTNNKKLKLTSFLRDSYIEIPGKGYAKLNAACKYGGYQLVIDTIEYNFKIKIDNFAMVDFDAFEGIVDTLGGVDVDVEQRESSFIDRTSGTKIPAGSNVHLNGKQALLYCRIRKLDSDFYRTQRQRKVMSAIKTKASDASLSTVLKTAETIMPYVETDISKSEMMALSMKAASTYLKYDVEQLNIPADKTWRSGTRNRQDVLLFDVGENTQILHKFIYGNND